MKKILKRGLAFALVMILVTGLLPVTAFAAVDSSGKPTDLNNTVVLSIYTPEGSIPGEPAMHGSEDYVSLNSQFKETSASGTFKSSAASELKIEILNDLVEGTPDGKNTVWGVFSADGLKEKYFKSDASIIQPANEAKIIRAIKGNAVKNMTDDEVLDEYEIIWYVIKLQHSPGSGWFSRATTEWHIDGVIVEKRDELISINYYGNGNTEGSAPDGETDHVAGEEYTVLAGKNMKKKINGVYVDFLGWSAKADGTGDEEGFYQVGDVITPTQSISLYAMWDTFTQHTATVRTYLDGVQMDSGDIHEEAKELHLSTDDIHFYPLTRDDEGLYTTKIVGNGKFHLYHTTPEGTYEQIGTHQLTIYNQNATLEVHHYSVTYDPNGGEFAENPGKENYLEDLAVNAVAAVPTKEGYRFLGWKDNNGALIQPGEEITAAIDNPITLTAQWEKTVTVTVNVTINHTDVNNSNGYDRSTTKDDVFVSLVSRADDNSPYLEVADKDLNLGAGVTVPTDQKETKYLGNVFTDMPGGTTGYTVVTSKSGYDTEITATQSASGNWTIDVVMTYKPSNFDLQFTVEVDDSVPDQYIPVAAIVKVTCWSDNRWQTITQHEGTLPGVRVDIDPNTRTGSGSYPVWKVEPDGTTPYGYRIQVTSFVYPDGSIVRASNVVTQDVAWTDNVYTATVSEVTGGKQFGTLDGAYITNVTQLGKLNAVISMELYNVTFDAQGGKVNGEDTQTVTEQYKIPGFNSYIPTREGGYTFEGWYEDKACTVPATAGKDLSGDITLYAKWKAPLTISGTVLISATYEHDGETVPVHGIDRAKEAVVILQELRHGIIYDQDSRTVSFGNYGDEGSASYSFTGIPDDGKTYQIHILLLNYTTTYDNESDPGTTYSATEYAAVFNGDKVAVVDAHLDFDAVSYDQKMNVDTTQISEAFRPTGVLSEVLYRDTGDNHAFQRISQHGITPFGVKITLDVGQGSGSETIWKWHTNGTLYDYQMNITKLYGDVPGVFSAEGIAYNSDTSPYYIVYEDPVHWDEDANAPSGEMQAILLPERYQVKFDLNAEGDTVTGMDEYLINDEIGYGVVHTWSYDTEITAVPQRKGYIFAGWLADVENAYVDGKITAANYQNVVLTAKWVRDCFTITTKTTSGGTTAGDGIYDRNETATVIATPEEGHLFKGWYEDGELVSTEEAYSFTVDSNRTLTAKFAAYHTITTIAEGGGTVAGGGIYEVSDTATITAEAMDDYYFVGWYENGVLITAETTHTLTVLEDHTFTAKFEKKVSYKCDYVYIFGYNDTEIGATGPLRRGELVQMIYRLVKQNNPSISNGGYSFEDTAGAWFESGVSYMASIGAIDATKAYAFPNASVSRGETYKMICLGLGFTSDANLDYSEYATILRNSGYLVDDGRVTAKIKRWEFCQLFNAILGRADYCQGPDGFYDVNGVEVTAATYGYTDLSPDDAYYRIMMIATSTFTNGRIDQAKRMERNTYDYTN